MSFAYVEWGYVWLLIALVQPSKSTVTVENASVSQFMPTNRGAKHKTIESQILLTQQQTLDAVNKLVSIQQETLEVKRAKLDVARELLAIKKAEMISKGWLQDENGDWIAVFGSLGGSTLEE